MLLSVIALSASIFFVGALVASRTSPFGRAPLCPNCQIPYQAITAPHDGGARRTYEVLACVQCANTTTRVLGAASRFAHCPSCNQRALEIPVRRLPPTPENPLQVEVEERCHVCGHDDVVALPSAWQPRRGRGTVIPFPSGRSR